MRSLTMLGALIGSLVAGTGCHGVSVLSDDEGRYVCGFDGCQWVEWTDRERFERAVAAYERNFERYRRRARGNGTSLSYDISEGEWTLDEWTDGERREELQAEHTRLQGEWNALHLMASERKEYMRLLPPYPPIRPG